MVTYLRAALVLGMVGLALLPALAQPAPEFKVLVFSKTTAFRHPSIANGIQMIQQLGAAHNFAVDATEDAARFSAAQLAQYDVVIFLNTTSPRDGSKPLLNSTQRTAFEQYIRAGGGYLGIHAASDGEYNWAWYGNLVGAYFKDHPAIQRATIQVENRNHPSTAHLGQTWQRTDEWYNFATNPRANVQVLLRLDETTYNGGNMGVDHPIAWYHEYDGGRSWYTAGGHTTASYGEAAFQQHVLGGILWAANRTAQPTPTTQPSPAPSTPPLQRKQFLPFVNKG